MVDARYLELAHTIAMGERRPVPLVDVGDAQDRHVQGVDTLHATVEAVNGVELPIRTVRHANVEGSADSCVLTSPPHDQRGISRSSGTSAADS